MHKERSGPGRKQVKRRATKSFSPCQRLLVDLADHVFRTVRMTAAERAEVYASTSHWIQCPDVQLPFFRKEMREACEGFLRKTSSQKTPLPFPPVESPQFRFIDLFAGVGGFRLAMQAVGGKCVFTSEWEKDAKATYEANYGEVPYGDIRAINKNDIPEHDILCGGFPCQAFSIAGRQEGFDDVRGTLFFDIAQIIAEKRPKAFFLENVKNLQAHDGGRTFSTMLDVLSKHLDYSVSFQVLNSMTHANVPQNRERIFIVGFDRKLFGSRVSFSFPNAVPLTTTIHDVLEHTKQDEFFYFHPTHPYYAELDRDIVSRDTLYQWRRIYVRENKSNVCPTLTANMGTGGHNVPLIRDDWGIRKLTPRECFRFQGYPESLVLPAIARTKLYMQAGNSVTMPLLQRIAEQIVKVL